MSPVTGSLAKNEGNEGMIRSPMSFQIDESVGGELGKRVMNENQINNGFGAPPVAERGETLVICETKIDVRHGGEEALSNGGSVDPGWIPDTRV